jgi:hypothetical protein
MQWNNMVKKLEELGLSVNITKKGANKVILIVNYSTNRNTKIVGEIRKDWELTDGGKGRNIYDAEIRERDYGSLVAALDTTSNKQFYDTMFEIIKNNKTLKYLTNISTIKDIEKRIKKIDNQIEILSTEKEILQKRLKKYMK